MVIKYKDKNNNNTILNYAKEIFIMKRNTNDIEKYEVRAISEFDESNWAMLIASFEKLESANRFVELIFEEIEKKASNNNICIDIELLKDKLI